MASMLYEMYWALVDKLGFQPDKHLADLAKGNMLALRLMVEVLKLQPCNPTFITARNAILQAEQQLTAGRHQCDLWCAFAKRGLGSNAALDDNDNKRIASNKVPDKCKTYGVAATEVAVAAVSTNLVACICACIQ